MSASGILAIIVTVCLVAGAGAGLLWIGLLLNT
jgi:hypothetical protein